MASNFSEIRGMRRLKKKLKRLPDEIVAEVRRANQDAVNITVRAVAAEAPVGRGRLRDTVSSKMSKDKLTWRVGYFKKGNKKKYSLAGWRAGFIIFGVQAGVFSSGPLKGKPYKARAANPFVSRAWDKVRTVVIGKQRAAVDRALKKASRL